MRGGKVGWDEGWGGGIGIGEGGRMRGGEVG